MRLLPEIQNHETDEKINRYTGMYDKMWNRGNLFMNDGGRGVCSWVYWIILNLDFAVVVLS